MGVDSNWLFPARISPMTSSEREEISFRVAKKCSKCNGTREVPITSMKASSDAFSILNLLKLTKKECECQSIVSVMSGLSFRGFEYKLIENNSLYGSESVLNKLFDGEPTSLNFIIDYIKNLNLVVSSPTGILIRKLGTNPSVGQTTLMTLLAAEHYKLIYEIGSPHITPSKYVQHYLTFTEFYERSLHKNKGFKIKGRYADELSLFDVDLLCIDDISLDSLRGLKYYPNDNPNEIVAYWWTEMIRYRERIRKPTILALKMPIDEYRRILCSHDSFVIVNVSRINSFEKVSNPRKPWEP